MKAAPGAPPPQQRTVVWRLRDGKPGHENQTAGLIEALWRVHPVSVHELQVASWRERLRLGGRGARLRAPDLIVGAGRASHRPLLALRTRFGGRAVVLMRPTLPFRDYDLCVVPRHDAPHPAANVLVTDGVLNRIRPARRARDGAGLVLIGGPSRHHDWLDREMLMQVAAVTAAEPERDWTICDSRRTPRRTMQLLGAHLPSLRRVHWRDASPAWLAEQLALTRTVWVSEDSVSMVYEGLSAGAAVGLLAVPKRRTSRVARGVAELVARGFVTPFVLWQGGRALCAPPQPLAEADRAARWIWQRWLRASG